MTKIIRGALVKGAARMATISAAALLAACERPSPVAVAPAPVTLESFATRTGVPVETLNALVRDNRELARSSAIQQMRPADRMRDFTMAPDRAVELLRTADSLRARYTTFASAAPPSR